jgi:DNA helicase-2/ATP-dependent DNA helicase PcrA
VLHQGSPLLILAGAGTGKTRVITTKIAYLVREHGYSPESILAVTFTNKAAKEMRERAAQIEASCERAMIRTFHSFGSWFLRRNAKAIGLDSNFVIYDDKDSAELVKAALPSLPRQESSRYASLIARAKDFCLGPDSPNLGALSQDDDLRRIYAAYEERLRNTGNVDFGDLISLPSKILSQDEAIAQRTRQRFQVVLVDEYQDSNIAQFELLKKLVGPATYICVVGDDDQSIYRFRGAEIKNILGFSKAFPGTKIIKLERNYRSYQTILDIAGESVKHNPNRLGKTLRATRPGGQKPLVAILDDQEQEVEYCASVIRRHIREGGCYSDLAILYRTNAQSLGFEKDFPRRGIPYALVGALRFYEREEIKDLLAYLSLIVNPRDEIAFRRIINKPTRGLGDSAVDRILESAVSSRLNMLEACKENLPHMKGRAFSGMEKFLSLVVRCRSQLAQPPDASANLGLLLETIIAESGLAEFHRSKDDIAGTQKLSNMEELAGSASLYPLSLEGLLDFLETIELDRSLQSKNEEGAMDAVTLITMHNTKGLEFPIVIVTGLEQGLFPRDDDEGEDLEEQRRLFYVSSTRAKNTLHFTACRWRRIRGRIFETKPSIFLTEINPSLYEVWKGSGSFSYRDTSAKAAKPKSLEVGWRVGQSVYHDEYGEGAIVKVSETESSGALVVVRFSSGKLAQFFPKYTKKLEKTRE